MGIQILFGKRFTVSEIKDDLAKAMLAGRPTDQALPAMVGQHVRREIEKVINGGYEFDPGDDPKIVVEISLDI